MEFRIEKYDMKYEQKWDDFVENEAANGCFLQEWKFLNYHEKNKFEDASLMFFEKEKLIAVCPAAVMYQDGKKVFCSHPGSTYGGLLVRKELLRIDRIRELYEVFEQHLKEQGVQKCILKMTMDLLCEYPQEVIKFFLGYSGYHEKKELNLYIDYSKYDREILNNFSKMKRRNVRKCLEEGLELRELQTEGEICRFHQIICKNLLKYGTVPVHTVGELMDLKARLGSCIEFYGVFCDGKMLAGTMVFVFEKNQCAHTQYLAADPEYSKWNPMAFVYYKMAEKYLEREFHFLSWGTATEHGGEVVNWNLANNKEEYGSWHMINSIFEKTINEIENVAKK